MALIKNTRIFSNYAQQRDALNGIQRLLFIARHPLLEAGTKMGIIEMEAAFHESESKYASIFQNNHTVMLLVDIQKWCIVDANPAACAFYGYNKEELVGKSISDINLLNRDELSERLADALQKPRTKFYFSHRTAGGNVRDVEVHTGPITIDGKQLLYSIIHDVTEQKRIEMMIKKQGNYNSLRADMWSIVWSDKRKSETDLIQEVLDCLGPATKSDPTIFFRIDRKTGDAIAEAEWNCQPAEGLKVGKVIPAHLLTIFSNAKSAEIPHDSMCKGEAYAVLGEHGIKSYLLIPYGDTEKPEGYFAFGEREGRRLWERNEKRFLHEMVRILFARTEQINLEVSIHQNEKLEALGRLAGGIAHDFNNMLSGISSYAELLRIENKGSPGVVEYADIITGIVRRMGELTRKLLAFARKGKHSVETLDMHKVIDDVFLVLERGVENKRITLTKKFGADNCHVEGDDSLIYNALLNLGLNARDAMPNGGAITYETRNVTMKTINTPSGLAPGEYILVTVRDNGAGMDEETIRKAFEPFFTTKDVGAGVGLGLPSVYGTVKNHNGHIEIHSKVGTGTAIEIYLPVSGKIGVGQKEEHQAPVTAHGTIMIVDDEPLTRTATVRLLEYGGHTVHEYDNGRKAIEFYGQNWQKIDFVMLDMKMPGLSGLACFRELKKINPAIKAMLVTGHILEGDIDAAKKEGMVGHLTKPFKVEMLLEIIERNLPKGK